MDLESWMVVHATALCDGRVPAVTVSLFEQGFDRQVSNLLMLGSLPTSLLAA